MTDDNKKVTDDTNPPESVPPVLSLPPVPEDDAVSLHAQQYPHPAPDSSQIKDADNNEE